MTSEPTMTDSTIEITGRAMIAQMRRGLVMSWSRRRRRPDAVVPGSAVAAGLGALRGGLATAGGHQQADLVLIRGPAVDHADQLAAVDDRDPVGQLEDLVELRGDQQDRRPGVALGDRLAVDELDAADIESARRLIEDEQAQVARELACDDDLLLVAAGQRCRADLGRRRPDVEFLDPLLGGRLDGRVVAQDPARIRRPVVAASGRGCPRS